MAREHTDMADTGTQDGSHRLSSLSTLRLADLIPMWREVSFEGGRGRVELYESLGNRILKLGEPLIAYDIFAKGLERWPANVRLRQLLALSLSRSGAWDRANEVLQGLCDEGRTDGETLGLLGSTHKNLWEHSTIPAERDRHLHEAGIVYGRAYRLAREHGSLDESFYTGINAASMAMLAGRRGDALALAGEVKELSRQRLAQGDDYWAAATLGEAAVLLGEMEEAAECYARASELGKGNYADLSSTRHNARLLLEYLGEDRNRFDHCFWIPRIVVFAGHMVDRPDRTSPRFPEGLQDMVAREIAKCLSKYDAKISYSGAACGSDILFLEEMIRQGGETNVVLPVPVEEFLKASVDIVPGADWSDRFRKVLEGASRVIVASRHHISESAIALEYSNMMQNGLALLRAEVLDTEVRPLVVWDGGIGDGPGGTAAQVTYWRSHNIQPDIVDLVTLLEQAELPVREVTKAPDVTAAGPAGFTMDFPQEIMAMLFADVTKYSYLREEQIPRFVTRFMGAIAELVAASSDEPVLRNSWGDAIFFVFGHVGAAGRFALDLRDRILQTNWAEMGLPAELGLRIALHAGPVYRCQDPVTKRGNYIGAHVTRAARMEPITPPGQVYASQSFAAVSAAARVADFVCDYVGETPLPKDFGTFPTYHVRRKS